MAVLLVLVLGLRWLSQPDRVASLVFAQLGESLGLEITARGSSHYRLRGTPQLVVRGLDVREPGATEALLRAERAQLSLPWSTLRERDADLTLQRIELDAPQLDLAALQRWLAGRPPTEDARLPTLTDGLRIVRGKVIGAGWTVDGLVLSMPSLSADAAVAAHTTGRLRSGDVSVPFDLHLAMTHPRLDAGLGAVGHAGVNTPQWRLPMRLKLSGRLRDGAGGLGLDRFRLGANARHVAGEVHTPFVYGLAGALRYRDGRLAISPMGLALRGREAIPEIDARGSFAWQELLELDLQGRMARWPEAWPALPPPIGQSRSPVPFVLRYSGEGDLSGRTTLQLQRDATRFDARLHLPDVLAWLDAMDRESPLPPIDGTVTTPMMEIAGATLHGVEIEFDDGIDEAP